MSIEKNKIVMPPNNEEYLVQFWAQSPGLYDHVMRGIDSVMHRTFMSNARFRGVGCAPLVEKGWLLPITYIEDGSHALSVYMWSAIDAGYKPYSHMTQNDFVWLVHAINYMLGVN